MALKITKQIGTSNGITNEAYVRISSYQINKTQGVINLQISVFLNESDSKPTINSPNLIGKVETQNSQIGNYFSIPMIKVEEVEVVNKYKIMEPTQVMKDVTDEEGNITKITTTEMVEVEKENKMVVQKNTPDFSSMGDKSIFEFGYEKLKIHLEGIFGKNKVEDC